MSTDPSIYWSEPEKVYVSGLLRNKKNVADIQN